MPQDKLQNNPSILVVGGGKLPIWKIVISAALYAIIIYQLIERIKLLIKYPDFELFILIIAEHLHYIGAILPTALFFR